MLHPKDYRKEFEAASLKKILQERDRIIEFMHAYENNKLPKKYYERDPSPKIVYLTNVDYLKEICELIKIKKQEEDSNNDIVYLPQFQAIDEVLSKFDEEKRKQFLEDLKVKDEELYYKYIESKVNNEND